MRPKESGKGPAQARNVAIERLVGDQSSARMRHAGEYQGTSSPTGMPRLINRTGGVLARSTVAGARVTIQSSSFVGYVGERMLHTTGRAAHYAARPFIGAGNFVGRTVERVGTRLGETTGITRTRNARAIEPSLPTYWLEDQNKAREAMGRAMKSWNGTWKGLSVEDLRTALAAVGMKSERILQIQYGIEVGAPSGDLGDLVIRNSVIAVSEVLPVYLKRITSSKDEADSSINPRAGEISRLTELIYTTKIDLVRSAAEKKRYKLVLEMVDAQNHASRIDYHMRRITAVGAALNDLEALYPPQADI